MISLGRGTLLGMGYIRISADTSAAEGSLGLLSKAAAGTVLAVAAIGITTTVMAANFNKDMLKISTQAGGTSQDVKTLSKDVLNMKNVQQGPDQLAESLYHLKSIGLGNADAMKDLRVASDLAAVGGSNLEATTNALGGAWRSGIKGAATFAQSAATVNAIIGAGNMRMEDFVAAIGTGILPAAKTFGVSLSSMGSALALMTDEGIPATDAATRLKMSLSLLAAPSNVASKQLAKIGLTGLQLANEMRSPAGLVGAIGLLKSHLDASGMSLSEQAILLSHAFGGGRSSSAILTMINNYDVLVKKQSQINNSLGNFSAAVAAQRATVSAQLKILESSLEATGIKIGEFLIPPVTKFMTFLNSTAIPGIEKFSGYLFHLVPVDRIKSDFGTVSGIIGQFYDGLVGKKQAASKQAGPTILPWSTMGTGLASGGVGSLAQQLMGSQVPKFLGNATSSGRSNSQLLNSQLPSALSAGYAVSAGPKSAAAGQSMVAQVPGSKYIPAVAAKPPDPSVWVKFGIAIAGAGLQILGLAKSLAVSLLPPITKIVVLIATDFLPVVIKLALMALPYLVTALKGVGIALGAVLGFLVNIGPWFQSLGGWGALLIAVATPLALLVGTLGTFKLLAMGLSLAERGVELATLAWGKAQMLLNIVTEANPFVLVATAVIALGLAFYYAYTHSKTFRDIVQDTFHGIKTVALDVFGFLTHGLGQFTLLLLGPIGVLLLLAVHWRGTWTVMKDTALAVAGWFAGPFVGFFLSIGRWFTGPFVGFFLSIGRWFTGPFVGFFMTIGSWFSGPFVGFFMTIGRWFSGPFVGFFMTIGRWFSGPFVGFFMTIGRWFSGPFVGFFQSMWNVIQGVLRFLVNGFLSMASTVIHAAADMFGWVPGIGGKLKSAAKQFDIFRDSVNAALGGVNGKNVQVNVGFTAGQVHGKAVAVFATGGPVFGAGTTTSDSIPARLSNDEHVWTSAEVHGAGGHGAVTAMRRQALGYARGGPVGISVGGSRTTPSAVGAAVSQSITDLVAANINALAKAVKDATAAAAAAAAAASGSAALNNSGGFSGAAVGAAQQYAQSLLGRFFWSGDQMGPLIKLWNQESGWNPYAVNPSSGAYGIPQALGHGHPYNLGDYKAQILWGLQYIAGRYGSPGAAWQHEMANNWYDTGGWLPTGTSIAHNGTGRPERVVGPGGAGAGGDVHIHVHNHGVIGSQRETENWLVASLVGAKRNGRLRTIIPGT
jgi:TP901 family phage tail tape measure protein